MELDEIELSVKGWNWGVAKFKGKSNGWVNNFQ